MRFLFLEKYFILIVILGSKGFCSESFFKEDFNNLPDISHSLDINSEKTTIHILSEEKFDEFFPKVFPNKKINHTSFISQMVNTTEEDIASGLLCDAYIEKSKLIGTGISTLHNFFLSNFENDNSLQINKN